MATEPAHTPRTRAQLHQAALRHLVVKLEGVKRQLGDLQIGTHIQNGATMTIADALIRIENVQWELDVLSGNAPGTDSA